MILYNIFYAIYTLIRFLSYALFFYCILSWFVSPYNRIMQFLARFIDPLLAPIRRLMWRFLPSFGLDFSPIIASVLLNLAVRILWRVYAILA